jgi:transcriptional regulator with XRE-family HTH domain
MNFGGKMDLLIKNAGLSQKDFALKIDMDYSHANKFFTGRKPNVDFLHKVIQVFPDVDLKWLLFSQEEETEIHLVSESRIEYRNSKTEKLLNDLEENIKSLKAILTQN